MEPTHNEAAPEAPAAAPAPAKKKSAINIVSVVDGKLKVDEFGTRRAAVNHILAKALAPSDYVAIRGTALIQDQKVTPVLK